MTLKVIAPGALGSFHLQGAQGKLGTIAKVWVVFLPKVHWQ